MATALLTGGVLVPGVPSAPSYSPLGLAVAGRPVLDVVDESVGTYALPVSAVLVVWVFVWRADLPAVRAQLGRLYPLVNYLVPPVLVLVTAARATAVARPAWRLLLDGARLGPRPVAAAGLVLLVALGLGWRLASRSSPRRRP
jgi:NSS family neurotransmitter:Na+ symporter